MELKKYQRGAVRLKIEKGEVPVGGSKFGGMPDLPENFQWPYFEGEGYDGSRAERPLSFLAQINCAEAAPFDREQLLPRSGMLYFFYELDSMRWGFDPKDKGCARVFYFEKGPFHPTPFPQNMAEWTQLPQLAVRFSQAQELPDSEEFELRFGEEIAAHPQDYAQISMIGLEEDEEICHKLLGYANPIQGAMLEECEMIARGYYCGDGYRVTTSERLEIQKTASRWNLLFQLDTVEDEDFELMFGDSGRIYYYITDEDLRARRFENCWLILQCC